MIQDEIRHKAKYKIGNAVLLLIAGFDTKYKYSQLAINIEGELYEDQLPLR